MILSYLRKIVSQAIATCCSKIVLGMRYFALLCILVYVCIRCAKSGHCACSTQTRCGPSTKSGHTRGPLLVLASDLDSSSLKTEELTLKLWGSLSPLLTLKLFLKSFYTWMKVRSWLKSHTFQNALHMLSVDHLNIDCPSFPVKCNKIEVRSWWKSYV